MGEAAGAAAGPASIASLGLSAFGAVMKGEATQSADEFQAAKAERAAQFGRLQAGLTDTVMRENLNTTLGNIEAIRAAAHTDPTSPTTAAVLDREGMIADRQRMATVLSIRSQADEDEASARYLRQAGDFALTQGYISAAAGVAGGIAKGLTKNG